MINGILTGAPLWVWPLFLLLVFLGYRASKPRRIPIIVMCILPLLGLISVNAVSSLPHQPIGWWCFGVGYSAGVALAYLLQSKWIIAKHGRYVSLAGEWFTMLRLMTIFWMNFASGLVSAINPQMYSSTEFTVIFALVVGWASGGLLGKALKVIRA